MPRTHTYGLDVDTLRFAQRVKSGSGRSIMPEPLKQINRFVTRIKKLGLRSSMVCWPMRSIHNAGTRSTVYSLGGLGVYNGIISNSPSWGYYYMSRTAGGWDFYNTSINPLVRSLNGYSCGIVAADTNISNTINFGVLKGGGTNQTGDNYSWVSTYYNTIAQGQSYLTGGNTVRGFGTTTANILNGGFCAATRAGLTSPSTDTGFVVFNGALNSTKSGTADLPSTNPYGQGYIIFGTGGIDKKLSFSWVSSSLTYERIQNIRTLYKQTLGIGLNLP